MAPRRKQLPTFFEESQDGKTVKCTICAPSVSGLSRLWILRKNAAAHVTSAEHANAFAMRQQEEGIERAKEQEQNVLRQAFVPLQPVSVTQCGTTYVQSDEAHLAMEERRMWEELRVHGANFDMGEDPAVALTQAQTALEHECDDFVFWDPVVAARQLGFDCDNSNLIEDVEQEELLANILNDEEPVDIPDDPVQANSQWFPYASQTEFLLDFVDRLPRIRISDSLMKILLWLLRETGARDVPSFYRLRKVQQALRSESGIPTIKCESVRHNIFYMNDPRALIAKDWANPLTRPHIHVYPEISDQGVSEVWHARKWLREMDVDALSPMYDGGERHFYVNELARLHDGSYIIPIRWIIYKKIIHAESQRVTINDQGLATVHGWTPLQMISVTELRDNYYDLEAQGLIPHTWSNDVFELRLHAPVMPNPLREVAKGLPMYTSFVDYFGDDVSGNRSKSWNKHWNAYMTHRNLPRELLQQEYHMHFLSTSPHATIGEQFTEFKKTVESTHTSPVQVYDALTGCAACFRLFVHAKTSDNPMQSEASSHIGGNGNYFCRKCKVGGSSEEKESTEGFETLFQPSEPRTKEVIRTCLEDQVALACRGVAQPVKDIQTATGVKDVYTQYWIDNLIARAKAMDQERPKRLSADIETELRIWVSKHEADIYSGFLTLKGFDPAKDTPIEILHTILLGLVKYGWHITHTQWNNTQKSIYGLRLQSTLIDGLSIHAIRANYILQYANSLIGRQLKTLAQTTVFHVHDIVSPLLLQLWLAIGELSALLWFPEIRDMAVYLHDVEVAIANILDTWGEIDPSKILQKIKLHLLTHIPEDIVKFGPLVGVCTEGFESFNAVFRNCSVLSNHLAPSRDIAIQLADQEGLKHRFSGGWWRKADGSWTVAGQDVQAMLLKHPMLQRLVGWTMPESLVAGDTKAEPIRRGAKAHTSIQLQNTLAHRALNYASYLPSSEWVRGRTCVSKSKDKCVLGSWVFFKSPVNAETLIGTIKDILIAGGSKLAIAIIDVFHLSSVRHPTFHMPCLQRRHGEETLMIVSTLDIQFNFNVQHDCSYAGCSASGRREQMQERCASGVSEEFIEHIHTHAMDRFVVNMHSFHNPHLIRSAIPRSLSAPQLLHQDRRAKHAEFSAVLREIQNKKRAARKEKRDANRAAAKATEDSHVQQHEQPPGETAEETMGPPGDDQQPEPGRKRRRGEFEPPRSIV